MTFVLTADLLLDLTFEVVMNLPPKYTKFDPEKKIANVSAVHL